MKTTAMLFASAMMAVGFAAATPASAAGLDLGLFSFGSHVCETSHVDHADIPNGTVLGPNVAPCENVLDTHIDAHVDTVFGPGPADPCRGGAREHKA